MMNTFNHWEDVMINNNLILAQQLIENKTSSADMSADVFVECLIENKTSADVLRLVLQSGFDHETCEINIFASLCARGKLELVKCFVECGVDIEKTDDLGYTPLGCAIRGPRLSGILSLFSERMRVALYLLEHGASATVLQGDYRRPLLQSGIWDFELFAALVQAGTSVQWDRWEWVNQSMDEGKIDAKLCVTGQDYVILHHITTKIHHSPIDQYLSILKRHGQDHTVQNDQGNLLFNCVFKAIPPVVDQKIPRLPVDIVLDGLSNLQRHGYDLTSVNHHNQTLWHVLLDRPKKATRCWFDALLQTSAVSVLDQKDEHGRTPLDLVNAWLSLERSDQWVSTHTHCKAFLEQYMISQHMPTKSSTSKSKI